MVIKSWSPANLQSEINRLRVESNNTDLTLLCRDISSNKTVKINAHKILLASLSPFLKELFIAQQLEQPYENITISLDSFNSNVVQKLVMYIYEGEILVNAIEKSQLQHLCNIMKIQLPLDYDSNEGCPVSNISQVRNAESGKIKRLENCLTDSGMGLSSEKMHESPHKKCFSSSIFTRSGKRKRYENVANNIEGRTMDNLKPCIDEPRVNTASPEYNNIKNELIPPSSERYDQYCVYVDKSSGSIVESPNCKVCPVCAIDTGSRWVLSRHMRTTHNMLKRYQCNECGVLVNSAPAFQLHVESQHLGIRYQCSECHFSSSNPYNLERHKKVIHEKLLPHKCYHCPYAAGQKKQLEYHLQTYHSNSGVTSSPVVTMSDI